MDSHPCQLGYERCEVLSYCIVQKLILLQGGWTVPGTVSACPIADPIQTWSPASALGSSASSAPVALGSSALLPLVFWFGHSELQKKVMLMERLIRNMGEFVIQRTEDEAKGPFFSIFIYSMMLMVA
jgi:polyribonucleotide 5'-hydroxyl-kinase